MPPALLNGGIFINTPIMTTPTKLPFLVKLSLNLLIICIIGWLVYIGKDIVVPLTLSMLLAVLLLPFNSLLERKGFPRVLAISISLIISITFIAAVVYFLFTQISAFADDIPTIKKQLHEHLLSIQSWAHDKFNLSQTEQTKLLTDATNKIKGSGSGFIGKTFLSLTQTLIVLVLLPVYTFLILYYRDMIRRFLMSVFSNEHEKNVTEVLKESRIIVQSYMAGLMIELAIVATINSIGFFIVGIQYAIFLGVLAAILNMIPYIGMLIASIFCMLVTLTTSTHLSDVIWVGVVLTVVQFIDNNIIMPKVVSSKVKINALISIIGVLIGGALAGVAGMFLSIPAIAILKVIFDRVDSLKPWGMLLGDDITGTKKGKIYRKLAKVTQKSKKPKVVTGTTSV
jgi:predicted PurR-regulated permease PerM